MKLQRSEIVITCGIAVACTAASWRGLSDALGAHPRWAERSGLIGALLGLGLFLLARTIGLAPKGIAIIYCLALIGVAGRAWYFGSIAIWASLTPFLSALAARLRQGYPSR